MILLWCDDAGRPQVCHKVGRLAKELEDMLTRHAAEKSDPRYHED